MSTAGRLLLGAGDGHGRAKISSIRLRRRPIPRASIFTAFSRRRTRSAKEIRHSRRGLSRSDRPLPIWRHKRRGEPRHGVYAGAVKLLSRFTKRVLINYDGDDARRQSRPPGRRTSFAARFRRQGARPAGRQGPRRFYPRERRRCLQRTSRKGRNVSAVCSRMRR